MAFVATWHPDTSEEFYVVFQRLDFAHSVMHSTVDCCMDGALVSIRLPSGALG